MHTFISLHLEFTCVCGVCLRAYGKALFHFLFDIKVRTYKNVYVWMAMQMLLCAREGILFFDLDAHKAVTGERQPGKRVPVYMYIHVLMCTYTYAGIDNAVGGHMCTNAHAIMQ
jgi:hypothetical protein